MIAAMLCMFGGWLVVPLSIFLAFRLVPRVEEGASFNELVLDMGRELARLIRWPWAAIAFPGTLVILTAIAFMTEPMAMIYWALLIYMIPAIVVASGWKERSG